jgi:hypothetical protein
LRERCDSLKLAATGTALSLLLIVIKLASFGLSYAAAKLAWSGRVPLSPACRLAYKISVLGSFANASLIIVLGQLCLQLTFVRLMGVSYFGLDKAMIGLMLLFSFLLIWKILDAQPLPPESDSLRLCGMTTQPEAQPELWAILSRIAEPLQSPMPDTVIIGLEPSIRCTRRPVEVDGAEIQGMTLFISLPLCRLISEAELIALISGEMLKCNEVASDWEVWINNTFNRWKANAEGDQAGYLDLLWLWIGQWNGWAMGLMLYCAQRSSAIAGRQNAAAGLAVSGLVQCRWERFLSQVQLDLRRGTVKPATERVNLSQRFAALMSGMAGDLAAAYWSSDEEGGGLPTLSRLLEVDAAEVGNRIAAGPSDRASDCLRDVEHLEVEVSTREIRRIFLSA